MRIEIGLVISQILAFLMVLWIMKKWAWKPFMSILEKRREKIQAEFDAIATQKKELQNIADTYAEKMKAIETMTRLKMEEALHKGEQIAHQIQQEAHKQAQAILQKAQVNITQDIQLAQKHLKEDVIRLVLSLSEKLIQEKMDVQKDQKIVERLLNEAQIT